MKQGNGFIIAPGADGVKTNPAQILVEREQELLILVDHTHQFGSPCASSSVASPLAPVAIGSVLESVQFSSDRGLKLVCLGIVRVDCKERFDRTLRDRIPTHPVVFCRPFQVEVNFGAPEYFTR